MDFAQLRDVPVQKAGRGTSRVLLVAPAPDPDPEARKDLSNVRPSFMRKCLDVALLRTAELHLVVSVVEFLSPGHGAVAGCS